MKTLHKLILCLAMSICSFAIGQQMQQQINMRIDSIGNAKIDMSMTMNASQWQVWQSTLGNNPAALKREMERAMPGYFLDNFSLEKDDMNRSFNLSLNAYGVCEIDKRGRWTVETDQKNANLTELTETKYMLVSSPQELGGTVQQTFHIEFPETASNIKVDKDSFGETVFQFEMEAPSGRINYMRLGGIALLLLGGLWTGGTLLIKK